MAIGDVQRLKGSALIQDILSKQKDIDAKIDSTSSIDFLLRRNEKPVPTNRLSQGIQQREDVQQLQTIQIDNRTAQINEFISEAPELESEIRKLDESGAKMREIDDVIRKSRGQRIEPKTAAAQQVESSPIGFAFEALGRGIVNTGRFFSSNLVRGIGSQVMNSIVNNPTSVQSAEERERSGTALSQIFFDAADAIDRKLDDIESFIGKKPEDLNIRELSDLIDPKKIISLVLESAPTTVALAATTIVTGGLATLPIIFTSVTGSETKELMARDDLSLPQKLSTATSIAAIEGILETVGLGAITKAGKQGLIRNAIRFARGEGGTELAQEAQAILQKEGVSAFKSEETWAQVLAAGVVGAISGVTIGTAIEAAQQGQPTAEGKPAPVTETEVDPDIASATKDLVEQGAQAQRERSPEQFIKGDRFQPVTVAAPEAELAAETTVQAKDLTEKNASGVVDPGANATRGTAKDNTIEIPREDIEELYNEAEKAGNSKWAALKRYLSTDLGGDTNLSIFDKAVGGVDSNLGRIDPKFKVQLINMEVNQRRINKVWSEASTPFINIITKVRKKMSRGKKFRLDLALANSNVGQIRKILTEYDKQFNPKIDPIQAFEDMQAVLEQVREMGIENNIDIGNIDNFYPRVVKNLSGLTKLLRGTPFRGVYSDAINKATRIKGSKLTEEEQVQVIDNVLKRGAQSTSSSSLKERRLNILNKDMLVNYFNSEEALKIYFKRISSAIAQQQFFKSLGVTPVTKTLEGEQGADDLQIVEAGLLKQGTEENIAQLIGQEINNGNLKQEDENSLAFLLGARFNIKSLAKPLRYAKTISTTMLLGRGIGSPIKQMADIARAVADSGIRSTTKSAARAFTRTSKLKLTDIDVEEIDAAMVDISLTGKIADKILRTNLFRTFDSIGKEILVNSKIDALGRRLRNDTISGKETKIINDIFGTHPELKVQLIQDLKDGVQTQDTKLLGFHLLARTQPISLSQLPPWYFTTGNGRVFYTLKTFQARRLDDIREEAVRDITGKDKTARERTLGLKRLIILMAYLTMGELATDELIKWVRGQKSAQDFPDKAWDSLFKAVGVNKYAITSVQQKGFWETLQNEFLSIPTGEADKLLKDFGTLLSGGDFPPEGVESARNTPIIGETYYFWFGAGKIKNARNYIRSVRDELKERRFTIQERFAVNNTLLRYFNTNPEVFGETRDGQHRAFTRLTKAVDANASDFSLPESIGQKYWEMMLNEIKEITALPSNIMK